LKKAQEAQPLLFSAENESLPKLPELPIRKMAHLFLKNNEAHRIVTLGILGPEPDFFGLPCGDGAGRTQGADRGAGK
jgi:hypothetical protein